jgi:hypothetical protein
VRGFLIIHNALSSVQLSFLNRAVDDDLAQHGKEWVTLDESLLETPDVISRSAHFDLAIENPTTLAILRSLIGELITLSSMSKPGTATPPVTTNRRMEMEATDHCRSIIPGRVRCHRPGRNGGHIPWPLHSRGKTEAQLAAKTNAAHLLRSQRSAQVYRVD